MAIEQLQSADTRTQLEHLPVRALSVTISSVYTLTLCGIDEAERKSFRQQGSRFLIDAFSSASKAIPKDEYANVGRDEPGAITLPALSKVMEDLENLGNAHQTDYIFLAQSVFQEASALEMTPNRNQNNLVKFILNYESTN